MAKKMLIGFLAGIASGFFGSGGGMILVPAFIYLLKLDEKKSRASSVFCILPMVIASSIIYKTANYIDISLCIKCAVGGTIRRIYWLKAIK
jgi:uncharacterized membrane protein YfcA